MIEFRKPVSKDEWNNLAVSLGASFVQSFEYGEAQESVGRKIERRMVSRDKKDCGIIFLVFYKAFSTHTFGYCPHGPILEEDENLFKDVILEIKKIAKTHNAFFVRIENKNSFKISEISLAPKFSHTGASFQPSLDWILKIEKPEEKLLFEMDQNARYSIKHALKNGAEVKISKPSKEQIDILMSLMEETSKRNRFGLHDKKYYESIFGSLNEKNSFFVTTHKDGLVVSSALILIFGKIAMYLFGGSSSLDRKVSASYLGQWTAVQQSKSMGSQIYDFGAVSNEKGFPKEFKGITMFKKKFGGEYFYHGDFYDIVLKKSLYYFFLLRKFLKNK